MGTKLQKIEAALGPLPALLETAKGSPTAVARLVNKSIPGLMIDESSIRRYRDKYIYYKAKVGGPAIRGSDSWLFNQMWRNLEKLKSIVDLPSVKLDRKPTPGTEDLALMVSDLHFGKRVERDGVVKFNLEKARENLKSFIGNARHLAENYIAPTHELENLVIFLLGDIVDGEMVYETQAYNLEFPVRQQIQVAAEALMDLFTWGSRSFKTVQVFCCFGNHGADIKMHQTSNFDLILYDMLEIATRRLENVEWHIPSEIFNNADVRGHRFHLRHKVHSQVQTAAGRAQIGGWFQRHKFDVVLTGHWHQCRMDAFNSIPIMYNGCLFGSDDFTESLSFDSKPQQWIFLISDGRPITLRWAVDLGV